MRVAIEPKAEIITKFEDLKIGDYFLVVKRNEVKNLDYTYIKIKEIVVDDFKRNCVCLGDAGMRYLRQEDTICPVEIESIDFKEL